MKKYLIFIIPLLIWGCEKKYDTVIDPGTNSVQVRNISSFTTKKYEPGDSLIIPSLSLNSSANISGVYIDVYSSDDSKLNNSPVHLYDDGNTPSDGDQQAGDNIFTNKYPLSQSYPNGKYRIEYFVVDKSNEIHLAAKQSFIYDNSQNNAAPVLADLIAPDTVVVDTPKTVIFMSIAASDSNGLNDIQSVYFITYRPDGTTSGNKITLLDDGGVGTPSSGDVTAGDGIFSIIIQFLPTQTRGLYRFEFQAEDRQNKLSNKIIHNILIQ